MTKAIDYAANTYKLTQPAILMHPHLDAPQPFMKNGKAAGEPKYSASFLLDADSKDLGLLKALVLRVAQEAFPGRNIVADFKAGKFSLPFKDGTKQADDRKAKCEAAGKAADGEFQRGKGIVVGRSGADKPPALAYLDGGKLAEVTQANTAAAAKVKEIFFFGAKVVAVIYFKAYEGGSNPDGVTGYLNSVLAVGGGERLGGGRQSATETFKEYQGTVTDDNPLDDETSF